MLLSFFKHSKDERNIIIIIIIIMIIIIIIIKQQLIKLFNYICISLTLSVHYCISIDNTTYRNGNTE